MQNLTSLFYSAVNNFGQFFRETSIGLGKIVLIISTSIIGIFVLLAFFRFGVVYWIYASVENWIAVRLGFDYYVSNLLATCFVSGFTLLLPLLLWYVLLGKKQAWGIGIMIGVQALMCIGVYTIGKGVCFDRRTGKPICYFADTEKGRIWSFTPGFEPTSGKPFTLYTRQIKDGEENKKIAK
jgi:hypothetical protein